MKIHNPTKCVISYTSDGMKIVLGANSTAVFSDKESADLMSRFEFLVDQPAMESKEADAKRESDIEVAKVEKSKSKVRKVVEKVAKKAGFKIKKVK